MQIAGILIQGLFFSFKTLYQDGLVYDSKSYMRKRRNVSFFVKYKFCDEYFIGEIDSFIKVNQCLCNLECTHHSEYYAIIVRYNVILPFIETCVPNGQINNIKVCRKDPRQS